MKSFTQMKNIKKTFLLGVMIFLMLPLNLFSQEEKPIKILFVGNSFTFFWNDSEEYARVLSKKINEKIRFQWINGEPDEEEYFFEFKIQMDEITKDVSLIVTDYSDEDELEEAKLLWNSLIADLKQVLGST